MAEKQEKIENKKAALFTKQPAKEEVHQVVQKELREEVKQVEQAKQLLQPVQLLEELQEALYKFESIPLNPG